jgi:hypothetical protein
MNGCSCGDVCTWCAYTVEEEAVDELKWLEQMAKEGKLNAHGKQQLRFEMGEPLADEWEEYVSWLDSEYEKITKEDEE